MPKKPKDTMLPGDFLVDLFPFDADRFCVGETLVRDFVDRDDIGRRRLRDVVAQPLVEEVEPRVLTPHKLAPRFQFQPSQPQLLYASFS